LGGGTIHFPTEGPVVDDLGSWVEMATKAISRFGILLLMGIPPISLVGYSKRQRVNWLSHIQGTLNMSPLLLQICCIGSGNHDETIARQSCFMYLFKILYMICLELKSYFQKLNPEWRIPFIIKLLAVTQEMAYKYSQIWCLSFLVQMTISKIKLQQRQ
jgi:hypothetical protein